MHLFVIGFSIAITFPLSPIDLLDLSEEALRLCRGSGGTSVELAKVKPADKAITDEPTTIAYFYCNK